MKSPAVATGDNRQALPEPGAGLLNVKGNQGESNRGQTGRVTTIGVTTSRSQPLVLAPCPQAAARSGDGACADHPAGGYTLPANERLVTPPHLAGKRPRRVLTRPADGLRAKIRGRRAPATETSATPHPRVTAGCRGCFTRTRAAPPTVRRREGTKDGRGRRQDSRRSTATTPANLFHAARASLPRTAGVHSDNGSWAAGMRCPTLPQVLESRDGAAAMDALLAEDGHPADLRPQTLSQAVAAARGDARRNGAGVTPTAQQRQVRQLPHNGAGHGRPRRGAADRTFTRNAGDGARARVFELLRTGGSVTTNTGLARHIATGGSCCAGAARIIRLQVDFSEGSADHARVGRTPPGGQDDCKVTPPIGVCSS